MSDPSHADVDLRNARWRLANVSARIQSAVDNNTVQNVTTSLLRQLSSTSTPNNINLTSTSSANRGFVVDMSNTVQQPLTPSQYGYTGGGDSPVTDWTDTQSEQNTDETSTMTQTTTALDQPVNNDLSLSDWLNSSLLFAIILFVKLMYDHKLGILLCIALFITFHFSDKKLQSQVYLSMIRDPGNQQKRSKLFLLGMVLYLSLNVAVIYFAFCDQHLYKSLYLHLPSIDSFDFWNLLWVLILTDFIIKFCCIILKAVIALLPRSCIPFNRRGKYYVCVEETSQLYRMFTPIRPWIYFLVTDPHAGLWFSIVLVIVYMFAKVYLVWKKIQLVLKSYKQFTVNMVFGTSPSLEDMQACDDVCAICHDLYKDPVKLSCSHIFCEDCVSVWFDREPTCPMCRAKITDNPEWRNGATSAHLQWY